MYHVPQRQHLNARLSFPTGIEGYNPLQYMKRKQLEKGKQASQIVLFIENICLKHTPHANKHILRTQKPIKWVGGHDVSDCGSN